MPRIKETTVYKYPELSDEAKKRARDWFREANAGDNFFAESDTENFLEELKALGFHVDAKRGLAWSGFWSQGDGASFAGTWYASDFAPGELLADRPEVFATPNGENAKCAANVELHRIAGELKACKSAGLTSAVIAAKDRWGFHMRCDEALVTDEETDDSVDAPSELADRFIEAARDLARQFYRDLEAEYTYQNSDEQIAESIIANEYEFTEDGRRA